MALRWTTSAGVSPGLSTGIPVIIAYEEPPPSPRRPSLRSLSKALNELRHGRKLISVAHRLSTVRGEGRILMVLKGIIVEDDV